MSWAANDVEGWDEVERNAVTNKLCKSLALCGFYGMDTETIDAVVWAIQSEASMGDPCGVHNSAWDKLVEWAKAEMPDAEANYCQRGIDA